MPMPTFHRSVPSVLTLAAILAAWGCGAGGDAAEEDVRETESAAPALGPVDGFDLPAEDLTRVAVGGLAPDFALPSFSGDVIRLSDYRGRKNVVLVFYRGHW